MHKLKTILTISALATLAASVSAQPPEGKTDKCDPSYSANIPNDFASIDKDGNGNVSKEEISEYVAGGQLDNLFSRWDLDESGELSRDEFCYR